MNSLEAFMMIFMAAVFVVLVLGILRGARSTKYEERRDWWEGDD